MSEKYICNFKGCNSRLDELQAAVLNCKLKYLDQDTEIRRIIAGKYYSEINNTLISLPKKLSRENSVFSHLPDFMQRKGQTEKTSS
jgi:Predicted pyridoxal phosphate-dependent enzyme apparently involved in regulation of cell wall biogenesis